MESRQHNVLSTCVEAYIERAQPIGSHLLVDAYHFPYSSATLRNDLAQLEEEGYLEQPHTSSGRVPTQKAYRFFVEHCLEHVGAPANETTALASLLEQWNGPGEGGALVKTIAKHSAHTLKETVVVVFAPHDVYTTGLTNLFQQPEFANQAEVVEMSSVIDALDEGMESVRPKLSSTVTVLIGSDNPFSPLCASVLTVLPRSVAQDGVLAVLGPLRMDYRRVVSVVRWINEHLS